MSGMAVPAIGNTGQGKLSPGLECQALRYVAELIGDDVEVVHDPLRCRGDGATGLERRDNSRVGSLEGRGICLQVLPQVQPAAIDPAAGPGQRPAVHFQSRPVPELALVRRIRTVDQQRKPLGQRRRNHRRTKQHGLRHDQRIAMQREVRKSVCL